MINFTHKSNRRANLVGKLGKGKQPSKEDKLANVTNELEMLKKQLIAKCNQSHSGFWSKISLEKKYFGLL